MEHYDKDGSEILEELAGPGHDEADYNYGDL